MVRLAFGLVACFTLFPPCNAGTSLLAGVLFALVLGNPFQKSMRALTQKLLALSVVGLGAGMNLVTVAHVGLHGMGYTIVTIAGTLAVGWMFGQLLRVPRVITLLIAVGTAICGGSAIAAVAPVLQAEEHDISVALGIVFMLNAMALWVFPPLGHALHMGPEQFGLWGALAIHDTSSVVGATSQFGTDALQIGTTVKLARALWIVPITLLLAAWQRQRLGRQVGASPKRPWFIAGFLVAAAVATYGPSYVPWLSTVMPKIEFVARRSLVMTLFFIGASLNRATLRAVGLRPFVLGVTLWVVVAALTLSAIGARWVQL